MIYLLTNYWETFPWVEDSGIDVIAVIRIVHDPNPLFQHQFVMIKKQMETTGKLFAAQSVHNSKSPLITAFWGGNVSAWLNLIHQCSRVSVWGGKKSKFFMVPPGDFPVEDGGPVKWIQTLFISQNYVSLASSSTKSKRKESNLLYRFTRLCSAIPHIWRLSVSNMEICHSLFRPHAVLCSIFKCQWNM